MSTKYCPLNMPKKPTTKDWERPNIIAAVHLTGISIQQLSVSLGYGKGTVGHALYYPCPKYERIIAERLDKKPQEIWPSRYHADGTPKSGRGERGLGRFKPKSTKRNHTSAKQQRNVNRHV
jgi:Ner family transcriptional regulator